MNKYYILGCEGCVPFVKEFKVKYDAEEFLLDFAKKYGSLDDKNDNWIDHVFLGDKLDVKTKYSLQPKIGDDDEFK